MQSSRLAGGLRGLGVDRGDAIMVRMRDCPEWLVALGACLRVGAALHLPDPAAPEAAWIDAVRRARPKVIISDLDGVAAMRAVCAAAEVSCAIAVRGPAAAMDGLGPAAMPLAALLDAAPLAIVEAEPSEPVVCLYTSGSTGDSKRIIRSRAQLWAETSHLAESMAVRPGDGVMTLAPIGHSYGLEVGALLAMRAGATLVTLPVDDGSSPPAPFLARAGLVTHTLASTGARIVLGLPFQWAALAEVEGGFEGVDRCISSAGFLPRQTFDAFLESHGEPIRSQYGSSEMGTVAFDAGDEVVPGTVGRPLPTVKVSILDDEGQPCPPGRVGRVVVQSPVIGPGYLEGSAAHQSAFTTQGFDSGDRGHLGADGRLVLDGRGARFLEVAGDKIDARKVEAALRTAPGVREAALVAEGGVAGAPVVAFVSGAIELDALRAWSREHLAPAERPARIIELDALPRSSLGKVQRGALIERSQAEATGRSGAAADPAGLRRWIIDTLGALVADRGADAGPIRADRPLSEVGVDSLTLTRLHQRLEAHLGRAVPVAALFDHPTPASLAAHLTGARPAAAPRRRRSIASDEPIAIVAMACRFPGGVDDPEGLWQALLDGRDLMEPLPGDRGWALDDAFDPDPDAVGRIVTRRGGFVRDVAEFDPVHFGISPREARVMDPQQRLALELAWEAFERGGLPPASLEGSATGVFLGVWGNGYDDRSPIEQATDGLSVLGGDSSVAAGRVAYTLGLRGPAMAIDTACSASLVALHLACRSLREGECDLALAGGVTVFSDPRAFIGFSRLRVLSPDGVCRPFAAGANGAVWSEGAGLVLVERLGDARRNGHPVLAIVKGSAINQDGRSQGLTAPNGSSQQAVIRAALADAGLVAADVDVVEAHGTGTALGDPIEAGALLATYGQRPAEAPARLGAVKANLGHTQAAAGVAGLMKLVLALGRERVPATPNIDAPSPRVPWNSGALHLTTEPARWPRGDRPRRAAVSAFGVSGTNAHLIVEEAPLTVTEGAEPLAPTLPLVLSGRDPAGLRAQASRWAEWLAARDEPDLDAIRRAAGLGRSHLSHRAAITADGPRAVSAALAALGQGAPHPAVIVDEARATGGVVFVFPGHGSQWVAMGRALLAESPAFAAAVDECDAALGPHLGWSVRAALADAPGAPALDRVDVVQPCLFAMGIGLAAAWRALGVQPAAVVGHSVGELAAAAVSGALSLADAARVVAQRARAIAAVPHEGTMLAVPQPRAEVERRLAKWGGALDIGVINSPGAVVVSGDAHAIESLRSELEAEGVGARRVRIAFAAHSHHMDGMLDAFVDAIDGIRPAAPTVPMYSPVLGGRVPDDALLDADFWRRNVRQVVRFDQAVAALAGDGLSTALELGGHPVLSGPLLDACGPAGVALGSLRRGRGGRAALHRALGALHAAGQSVDWARIMGPGPRAPLPTQAFQRQRYWIDAQPTRAAASGPAEPAPSPLAPAETGLGALPPDQRAQAIRQLVIGCAAAVLGHTEPTAVRADTPLGDQGLDSLMAVELRNRLRVATGVELPSTVVYDHPTPARLSRFINALFEASTADAIVETRVVDDPIAIVGIGLRLPGGVDDLDGLWALLESGRHAVGPVPPERFDIERWYDPDPEVRDRSYVRNAAFIDDAAGFDSAFFGISPREAAQLDPQQRLLLETGYEALESAGIAPDQLADSATGVYVGIVPSEYGGDDSEAYGFTGQDTAFAAGRVAYTLGLQGPALSLNTACSSSLVALHLAVRSLRRGECSLALAAGVNVMAGPETFVVLSRSRALAPDGRSKTFAAAADGYGRGEGVVTVALQRLGVARAAGRPVLGIVRGTAVNHDGESNGITAPNGTSQQKVIRAALADAGLRPGEVDSVECHGTGTRLGDPIEVHALAAVYGAERAAPLWLGAIKPTLGHLEAGAGLAGIARVLAAMRHDLLPALPDAGPLNPHIEWGALPVEVLVEHRPWPRGAQARRAGVSSFGMSGTNAHVIIEEPPQPAARGDVIPASLPLLISGRDVSDLQAQAARWASALGDVDLDGARRTAALGRAHLGRRAAVHGDDLDGVRAGLSALAAGEAHPAVLVDAARAEGGVVFAFPGHGSQWVAMGRALLAESAVFAEAIAACEAALAPHVDWSLRAVLAGEVDDPPLDRVDVVQPCIFAMSVALTAVWRTLGVVPAAVIGHSVGELAAAVVAGALSLEDGARIVACRGRAIASVAADGAMLAVRLPADALAERLKAFGGALGIGVINSADLSVASGDAAALDRLRATLDEAGIYCRRVRIAFAAHSHHMDGILDAFVDAIGEITPRAAAIPIYSPVTGGRVDSAALDAAHWRRNVRDVVRFDRAVEALADDGYRVFVEQGGHPVLTGPLGASSDAAVAVGALRREAGGLARVHRALSALHVAGHVIDWASVMGTGPLAPLPTHAFQRQRYWLDVTPRSDVRGAGLAPVAHPLLGAMARLAGGDEVLLTGQLSLGQPLWLTDHRVFDAALMPGTGLLDLALAGGRAVGCARVAELILQSPLVLPEEGTLELQVRVGEPDGRGHRAVTIHTRPGDDAEWTTHVSGEVAPEPRVAEAMPAWPPPGAEPIDISAVYAQMAAAGLGYGPRFQGLGEVWRDGEVLYGQVTLPDLVGSVEGYGVHPALLDAGLHTLAFGEEDEARLPFVWTDVTLHATGARSLRYRFERGADADAPVKILGCDAAGEPVISGQLQLRTATQSTASRIRDLYRIDWHRVSPEAPPDTSGWLLVGGELAELPVDRLAGLPALRAALDRGMSPPRRLLLNRSAPDVAGPRAASDTALAEVQALLADERLAEAVVIWLTRGAVASGPGERLDDLSHAPLWGLVRTALQENPDRRFRLLDLHRDGRVDAATLAALGADHEPELAVRFGQVRAPRLVDAGRTPAMITPPDDTADWALDPGDRSGLDGVHPLPATDAPLEPRMVEVEVRAAGVNFRDVLNAMGMVPAPWLGLELAGVVRRVGAEVDGLVPGDRVMGHGRRTFGTVARAERLNLVPMPRRLSFVEAATVPMVYSTALYALRDLAGLRAGERVLIHAAAGGVGMAAVQIARHIGAEVFATASRGKWPTLRAMGIPSDHIANSRTLDFEGAFAAVTGGAGVDVVLDALAGEFVDASLRLLPRGGRFIEMGKADLRDPAEVAAAHPGVRYRAFDLDEIPLEAMQAILAAIAGWLGDGALQPLPHTVYALRHARQAFDHMFKARHIGKLVLQPPQPLRGPAWVTGGLGELGQAMARHLVAAHGITRLVLTSRRGPASPAAAAVVDALSALGAEVVVAACDVADRAQVEAVVEAHAPGAVFHLAGVLDDGIVTALDPDRMARAMAPKVSGAWHLHEATAHLDLSAFVLFSSMAGVLGGPGQANYAAANVYLDALAAHRRARGLPGLSLAWGLWAQQGTGMTAHLGAAELARIAREGFAPLSVDGGLALLDAAMERPDAALLPIRLDQKRLARRATLPPVWSHLVRPSLPAARAGESAAAGLAALPAEQRPAAARQVVAQAAAAVLGHGDAGGLDAETGFTELGLDSLMAVELRNRLRADTGVDLPSTVVFDHPTIDRLARFVVDQLAPAEATSAAPSVSRVGDSDAIAIVGVGLRLPGGVIDLSSLWAMLAEGRDGVRRVPADRFDMDRWYDPDPDAPGKSYVREAAFCDDVAGFDPAFFGISPREAKRVDPRHRLLLETTWEALEDAGIPAAGLTDSRTGVYVGIGPTDYGIDVGQAYGITGHDTAFAAGRLAYTLGLQGPALSINTACSSSLVALHLAVRALRSGECALAIAAGVNVLSAPEGFIVSSSAKALAKDGRSKAFSAAADGYGRGEGAISLTLERLDDARAAGRSVIAVVRGTAINHDGPSSGITAPNGTSQQKVIREALADAGLEPLAVDTVECHGTGTKLGDPIEVNALSAVYGPGREAPLALGTIKPTMGHLEAGAGLAGVARLLAALTHEALPPTPHALPLNPHIAWDALPVEVVTEARPWPRGERTRRAGVSSFGMSGTNAHAIIEEGPPPVERRAAPMPAPAPVLLSARDAGGLRAQARRWAEWLDGPEAVDADALRRAAAMGRSHLSHRAAVFGDDTSAWRAGLDALAAGEPHPKVVLDRTRASSGAVFVFPGHGSQWVAMGRELLSASPAFAEAIDACDAALAPHLGWSVRAALADEPRAPALERVDVVQPALFAMGVALSAAWGALGVRPVAVVGHSVGELAAAVVAGALSLEDGARIVAVRGRLIASVEPPGAMLAAGLSAEALGERLAHDFPSLGVGVVNSAGGSVASGPTEAIEALEAALTGEGVWCKRVRIAFAAHSPLMDGILDAFAEGIGAIEPQPAQVPIYSPLTGGKVDGASLDTAWWVRNVRDVVRFDQALAALVEDGHGVFIEQGGHPVLAMPLADAAGERAVITGSLRRGDGSLERLHRAVATLHTAGYAIDWHHIMGDGPMAKLPTYAFQRQRYWLDDRAQVDVESAGLTAAEHPLLGAVIPVAGQDTVLATGRLSLSAAGWLADHRVFDAAVVPGTGVLDLALAAGRVVGCGRVVELTLQSPMVVPDEGAIEVQVRVGAPDSAAQRPVTVHAREGDGGRWVAIAEGTLAGGGDALAARAVWPPVGAEALPLGDLYERLDADGLGYGPSFRGLERAWTVGSQLAVEVKLPEGGGATEGHAVHPALLDAALHALALDGEAGTLLPFAWSEVVAHGAAGGVLRALLQPGASAGEPVAVEAWDAAGAPVLSGRLELRAASRAAVGRVRDLYRVDWSPVAPADEAVDTAGWLSVGSNLGLPIDVVADAAALGRAVAKQSPTRLLIDVTGADARGPVAATSAGLSLLQAVLALGQLAETPVVWVTRGAVSTRPGEALGDLSHAPLWGLLRAARSEHPDRSLRVVDASVDHPSAASLAFDAEPELAERYGLTWAPRLVDAAREPRAIQPPPGAPDWALDHGARTGLDGVRAVAVPEAPVEPGMVQIAVRASGVNFRDVLNAMGMVPAPWLGLELTGVVTAVGEGVDDLRPGDRVMGHGHRTFSTRAVAERWNVTTIPDGLDFVAAATVPMTFTTALYGLRELAGLTAGERVLIHAAAGGVGMAAVQIARALGAEVFATASRGKWPTLRAMGIAEDHIASSRTLDFEAAFMATTGGAGVDVVLDALSDEFVDASLRLLPRGGRFIEMGKADVRDPAVVAAAHPGVAYQAFDLADVEPPVMQAMLGTLSGWLASGEVKPLPRAVYDTRLAAHAFDHMFKARHIGKLVLQAPRALTGPALITGGLGALGRATARHLVQAHGIRRLVLTSRRGPASAGAEALVAELTELGAEAIVAACDVADAAAVDALVERHQPGAVFHLAGVLDDGVVDALSPERLAKVLAPKVEGAWHLHQATAGSDLSAFVLFSSTAGVFGAPGQGNYAAANVFLDRLAAHRRAQGLPGLSLAWGLWAQDDDGMTAHLSDTDYQRMAREGFAAMDVSAGLALLDAALARPEAALVPMRLEPARIAEQGDLSPLWSTLIKPKAEAAKAEAPTAPGLAAVPAGQRPLVARQMVATAAAAVLGHGDPSRVDPDTGFGDLGVDSLMAVELRNRLRRDSGLSLPSTVVFDHPSVRRLADHLVSLVIDESPAEAWTDAEVRRKLSRVSIDTLRSLGLLEVLMAQPDGVEAPDEPPLDDELDPEEVDHDELLALLESELGDFDE